MKPDPLRTVLEALDLQQTDDDTFTGGNLKRPGGRVFGGQVLAQSLLAAARTVDADRLPHSVHGYFLRAGDVDAPITFVVERMRDGRSFTARRTHALQNGAPILAMTTSFQERQPGLEHADSPPTGAPAPDSIPSAADLLAEPRVSLESVRPTHRFEREVEGATRHPLAESWTQTNAFDLRHVEESIYLDPPAVATDRQLVWMRARGPVPRDQVLHRALLAYACDQVLLEPLLRRHGLSWATPGLSIASLDHAMWFHRDVAVDSWLLYVQSSPSAQGGRGLGAARVYDSDGTLVASIAQEGMLRVPAV